MQCLAKHAACTDCGASRSTKCASCVDGVYEHIHWLDTYVLAAKVRCPNNEAYGCRCSVPYCLAGDHQLVCAHAPCCCPKPGCIFLGSPPTLRDHLASHHNWVVTPITCGKCIVVEMQLAERRRLLAAEEWDNVFVVVASERRGVAELHVMVVRVRASAEEGPTSYRYVQGLDARARGRGDGMQGCPHAGGQGEELC
jgi:E3 ubiquitin-protein ligase SIAH1